VKVEARIFLVVAVFCWAVAIMYGIWTDQSAGGVEPVGVAALILSGGLMAIAGSFFWFVSRRIDPRPEDRPDAEIAEGAGDLGFFSPGSYWPIGIAGVMGGATTEVSERTRHILLESANFSSISIRRTLQALRLASEAAQRFGRGVDSALTLPALVRASRLMEALGGGTMHAEMADTYPQPPRPRSSGRPIFWPRCRNGSTIAPV
jgi:hypothetical protein